MPTKHPINTILQKGAAMKQQQNTKSVVRDHTYYIILNRVKKKYPDYTTAQLYAVASALRLKALEQNNAQA